MEFEELARGFLAAELAADPALASTLGATEHDERLPDLSASAIAERERSEDAWAERFSALSPAALLPDQAIDRELVLLCLARRRALRDWAAWRRDPEVYANPALEGTFALVLQRLRAEPELAAAAAARLRAVPALVDAGIANLDAGLAPPVLVRRARASVEGGIAFVRDGVAEAIGDPALRAQVAEAGTVAAAALERYAAFLTELADRAVGEFAIGESRYTALLRKAEGLADDTASLHARGRAAYAELETELRRRTRALTGHEDWKALLDRLNRAAPVSPEAMLRGYAEATARARAFCAERALVSFPDGEECRVEPAAPFTRATTAVAHYWRPPPLAAPGSGARPGHFFVPYPPADAGPAQVRERLEGNSLASIPSTAVHETYPGHHWHLAWAGSRSDRPLRALLRTSFFTEGWALYAEEMMREQGFFGDPREELCQVEARSFRAARIVVDTALHTGEMTISQAVAFLTQTTSLPLETARAEVARYCADPTQAASYLTGALEIARLRAAWPGTLREFHDRLAGAGELPLALAARALTS